ncbi:MAG TPA: M56 family metallopeptidase [Verrucomicrobiae bacterium]
MEYLAQFSRLAAETLAPLIVDVSLKATLLLLLAAIIASICKRKPAALRHQIWLLAILAVLALPLISFSLPAWRILPVWSRLPVHAPASVHAPNHIEPQVTAVTAPKQFSAPNKPTRLPSSRDILLYATAIWASGCVFAATRLAASVLLLRLSIRRSQPATNPSLIELFETERAKLNLSHVNLRIDDRRLVPFVSGIFRPCIVLPAGFSSWSDSELKAVLRHELAHVKRRDVLTLTFCSAACVLHWFNPLVWLAARELNIEAEKSCDDYVLTTEINHADYATQLVTASWFALESDLPALAITRRSQLERRVRAALEPHRSRSGLTLPHQLATASITLLVLFPLALAQPQNARAQKSSTTQIAARPFSDPTTPASNTAGANVAIELHDNGTSSLTLDQFNLPEISKTLARIADREPRSLVLIRHTGQTNHAAVVKVARLCREAGLRCTFVSNRTRDTSLQLPPEFQKLPSKARLVSLNVDSAGKFALRAHGFLKPEVLATLADLQTPTSRVLVGSRELFREFSDVQLAARAVAMAQ